MENFIRKNYTPFSDPPDFLTAPTTRTKKLYAKLEDLFARERKKGGVLDIDTKTPSTIISHQAGYIDKNKELIFGLQTDAPLKRAIKPKGGVRIVKDACESRGYKLDPQIEEIYTNKVKTHNDAVFSFYKHSPDIYLLRKKGILTGLPDNYGRGRIIGDYRRVALFGTKKLINDKLDFLENFKSKNQSDLQLQEEIAMQIQALEDTTKMADSYGFDISVPAKDFKQAVQWLYFAYLAAVKEQDGAAMSMGRIDAFLDIYAEKDLRTKKLNETQVQEIIDDFIMKLRLVRQLRVPKYDEIFAGDPAWITFALGGMCKDGRPLVTKTTYRILQTLYNLSPAPEPNLTVLWSKNLPEAFKKFASKIAIDTSSIQFENDDLMRKYFDDDYGVSCCVSGVKSGGQVQFFGARCNLPKLLLLAINQGRDETDNERIFENVPKINLAYEEVEKIFFKLIDVLAEKYVKTMNIIHYCHDRYYYESAQMALLDPLPQRLIAFGIAGLSIVADSLSAIKYAKVKAKRNKEGVATAFEILGQFPTFGSDDDRVDEIAIKVVEKFLSALKKHKTYRNAKHTLSLLTITSNVMYGKKTGETPDGRAAGEPFAPGANPMHNRDKKGAIASLNSVAKIPYRLCLDGISNTFSIHPQTLGKTKEDRINNLQGLLDGYFKKGGHHININVINRETLRDAMNHPEKYPNLTIRVSGYAVKFTSLSREHQREVLSRTFHQSL